MGKPFVKGDSRINLGGRPRGSRTLRKSAAAEILGTIDELQHWTALLNHSNPRIRLDTLKYLTDRRDGKPKQAVDIDSRQTCVLTLDGLPEMEL